jgi:hypothetical protein
MRRTWVIRGGEDNRLVQDFIESGVTGVGYRMIGDGTTVTKREVSRVLREAGRTVPAQRAARFESFVHEIQLGDVIVMPDTPGGDIVIGEVTGDYEFHEDLDPDSYRHRRPVRWVARQALSTLPPEHENINKQRVTLKEAVGDDLDAFLTEALADPVDRAATARPSKAARGTSSSRVEPVVSNDLLCPGCHLLKNPVQFEPGDPLCTDCR